MKNALKIATLALVGSAFIGGETEGMAPERSGQGVKSQSMYDKMRVAAERRAQARRAREEARAQAVESNEPKQSMYDKMRIAAEKKAAARRARLQARANNDALSSTLNAESENNGVVPPPPPAPSYSQHRRYESGHGMTPALQINNDDEKLSSSEAAESNEINNSDTNSHSSSAHIKDFQSELAKYSQNEEDSNEENLEHSKKGTDVSSETDKDSHSEEIETDDKNQSDPLSVHGSSKPNQELNDEKLFNEEGEVINNDHVSDQDGRHQAQEEIFSEYESDKSINDDEDAPKVDNENLHVDEQVVARRTAEGSDLFYSYVNNLSDDSFRPYAILRNALVDKKAIPDDLVISVQDVLTELLNQGGFAFYPELFNSTTDCGSLYDYVFAIDDGDVSFNDTLNYNEWLEAINDLNSRSNLYDGDFREDAME